MKAGQKVYRNMKYGITIPRDYDEAIRLDHENGNDYWLKAINKEINVV